MVDSSRFWYGWIWLALVLVLPGVRLPAQTSGAEQYAEQGQAALAAGHLDEAQQAFEKLAGLEPGVAEVHAMLGRIYFQQRHYDRAVHELRIALKQKPTLPKASVLLAISLSEITQYREALPELEKCFRQSTDPAEKQMCGLQLERASTGLKMDRRAVEVALEMDRLYPNDPEVLYHSSQIYGNMAFKTIRQMNLAAPNSPWRYLAAAEVNESQGASAAAINQYRQVLTLDPTHPGIHYRIGRTLLAEGRKSGSEQSQAEALKEFLAELEIDPANANAAYEAGEIYRNAGDLENAQKYFQAAISYYSEFEDAHIGLATVYLAQQKPDLAVQELKKSIALDPTNEVSWYRLSQAERTLGDTAEQAKAMTEFRKLHQAQLDHSSPGSAVEPSEVTRQKIDPGVAP